MPAYGLTLEAAYVVIVAVTGVVWTLQAWSIRMFIRLKIHGPLGWDDIFCTIATCFAAAHTTLTIVATRYGLGHRLKSLQSATINKQRMLAWINNQFYIATLTFSMLSVCFLLARVTRRTQQATLSYAIAGLTVLWAVICMPVLALDCDLPHPWISTPRSRCTNIYHVWLAVTITKTLLEGFNILLAVKLLWGVNMPWKAKAAVVAAFTIRLLIIPPSLTRLRYIRQTLHSTDWSYARIRVVIITQVVLHVSVILATVPCIKPWLAAFESGGLQPPPEVRKESAAIRRTPLPSPMISDPSLRFATPTPSPPPPCGKPGSIRPKILHRSISHEQPTVLTPGAAGHRRRVEAWPLKTYKTTTTYSVTAEHAPDEVEFLKAARKLSTVSSQRSSEGIIRTKSFSVQHDDVGDYFQGAGWETPTSVPTPDSSKTVRMGETMYGVTFEDAGGLLRDEARGSRATVEPVGIMGMVEGCGAGKGKGRAGG